MLFDHLSVGVSEAIAWLGLRDLEVLPNMDQSDTLTDGQLFDALRMGIHAEGGPGVDRSLDVLQVS